MNDVTINWDSPNTAAAQLLNSNHEIYFLNGRHWDRYAIMKSPEQDYVFHYL